MSTHTSDTDKAEQLAAAVAEYGALPVPVGHLPQPSTEQGGQAAPDPLTMAAHRPVADALVDLIGMFGHLPVAYVTMHSAADSLDLQVDTAAGFEAWRAALQITPDAVELGTFGDSVWLEARSVFRGVRLELCGDGLGLAPEQAAVPPPGAGAAGPGASEGAL
ncbi:hypothetical protein [Streptomyces sp. LNU-CPARS28]|uniref:hypothetical protein n=1 Tax=Streptomyces sp. LNU-CPARS28 TaxID=3137371 RepID=UPI0031373473